MDFDLPADLEEYRKQVREFSLREFTEETAMMHDIKEKYPDELRKKALESGIIDFSNPWKTMLGIEEMWYMCHVIHSACHDYVRLAGHDLHGSDSYGI